MKILDRINQENTELSGDDLFTLYDAWGPR
jgi:alanyl-tRNA synthetase